MTPLQKYRLLCDKEESIPLFSRDWWLDTACGAGRWDVILIEQKGQTVAVMPVYKPLPGLISMPPYTQTMGPWFPPAPEDAKYSTLLGKRQAICKELTALLKPYSSFLQQFPHTFTDWLPFYWEGYKQTTRYTYILYNIADEEKLWNGMAPNIRRNITKAKEKNGIIVRKGIPEGEFLNLFAATFKRQNLPAPGDMNVLKELIARCRERNQGDLWGGYDNAGRLHAAAFVAWQPGTAYYIAGGGDPALRDSGAHSLVMWETIRYASLHSSAFDFEGSMLPGVERFFREFGATQTPYFTISKGKLSLFDRVRIKLANRER